MSGKWKKIIWAILMLQLVFLHLAVSEALYFGGFYVSGIFLPGMYFHGYNIGKIIFFLLWAGAFVTGGCYYLGYRKFRRECITFLYPVTDETVKQQYIAACEEVNLKKRNTASLYYNDRILSPFVMGYPNQLLLLPEEVQKNENLQLLMLHECYHMKQRDNGYKLFLLAANCLLWFHPFAYLLRSISYRDIEIACDEAVVKGKSKEERYRYGQFLIDSIQKGKKKNLAYSTFFYGSKNLMKARISAVMEEKKKWDFPAQAAILLLILETAAAGIGLLDSAGEKYEEMTKPFNLYENYSVPEFYTNAAVEAMIQLEPVEKDSYYEDLWERDRYEEKEYDEIEAVPEGPWQFRVKDPDFYGRNLDFFLERFLYYYEDQETGSLINYEAGGGVYRAEVIWSLLLSGNQEESVWAIRFKEYVTDYENLPQYQNGWVRISDDGASRHAYYEVAVHIRMVEPYLYELEGIADLEGTLTAYGEKYPNADFSDIPQ